MTFNEIQYWRRRADRFRTELLAAYAALDNGADREDVKDRILGALPEAPPAMDEAPARAWRESDGDHRNHVEDRK